MIQILRSQIVAAEIILPPIISAKILGEIDVAVRS
jgi:hypothetical protein